MTFKSILFEDKPGVLQKETLEQPPYFSDLNIDQIIDELTVRKQEYNLRQFLYTNLYDEDTIRYRHEVMQDLEKTYMCEAITEFTTKIGHVHRYLAAIEKLESKNQKEIWFLEAVDAYCEAVINLERILMHLDVRSRGFTALREYITSYVNSERFNTLTSDVDKLKAEISTVRYCVAIKEDVIKVKKYESEPDYSLEIDKTFEKFKHEATRDRKKDFPSRFGFNHIETKILGYVAKLYHEVFSSLNRFYSEHSSFIDETIRIFTREVQFYIVYLEYIGGLKEAGLKFCYPKTSISSKEVYAYETYDIALASKNIKKNLHVVCNDFYLKGEERIIVVSGPNQGGKTTFARAFGQLHYLASIGYPVPGREARLFIFDQLFTLFGKEEDVRDLQGRLKDDLIRIRAIVSQATSNSVVILNEVFASTTYKDAIILNTRIMEEIVQLNLLCVWVTFESNPDAQ